MKQLNNKKLTIILCLISFICGIVLTSFILYYQIQNRYIIGKNCGKLEGEYRVLKFLKENISNDSTLNIKQTDKNLSIKCSSISIIEINGIQTIKIEE
ncbi:hypothetical protein E0494_10540 [Marinilabiliaceae bacterium JC040]|nr:hypothetical protein [Marinilabiliaceae bacterium JC040]